VAVVKASSVQFQYRPEDVRVEFFSGTGAGGQHRNKKQCSVRMTHTPTNIVVTVQSRSKEANVAEATTELRRRLHDMASREANTASNEVRSAQVGSGMRGDKVRTYRFRDDAVEDHRNGRRARASKVMQGYFDLLW